MVALEILNSQLEKIPMSQERQERLLNEQIWEIENGIRELKASNGERFSIKQLEKTKKSLEDELNALRLDLKTLNTQKRNAGGKLSDEKEKTLADLTAREEKQGARLVEVSEELEELNQYMSLLEHKGKACADKIVYPGVEIYIKDKDFKIRDNYNHVTFLLRGDEIDIATYEQPVVIEGSPKMTTVVKSAIKRR